MASEYRMSRGSELGWLGHRCLVNDEWLSAYSSGSCYSAGCTNALGATNQPKEGHDICGCLFLVVYFMVGSEGQELKVSGHAFYLA